MKTNHFIPHGSTIKLKDTCADYKQHRGCYFTVVKTTDDNKILVKGLNSLQKIDYIFNASDAIVIDVANWFYQKGVMEKHLEQQSREINLKIEECIKAELAKCYSLSFENNVSFYDFVTKNISRIPNPDSKVHEDWFFLNFLNDEPCGHVLCKILYDDITVIGGHKISTTVSIYK